MKKKFSLLVLLVVITVLTTACSMKSAGGSTKPDDVIDIVWYPNESGSDMKSSRDEIANVIEESTGKKVEHHLTTDYAIAIETIVNNNADVAFMGAQGYIEAHKGNEAIKPLVVPTGPSGTLEDAVYHSWLAVNADAQETFKKDGEFSLDTIEGKKMSFVSGFKVPAADILNPFTQQEKYADLTEMDLMKGGSLFSKVLFGNSHQGSAVNLLKGNADVAAFCDTCVENYVEVVEGKENTVGAVYQVQDDAAEPFDQVTGKKFTLMSVTPVLNAPFVANVDVLGQEDLDKLQNVFTSGEVANNEEIFVPEDSGKSGLFFKTGKERFAAVKDSWFDPIRDLSN
ncbi:PhnD/SsuA/transferrin family substrate-binding protein [Halobacillus karajensis]|uniref:Phosphate-import protein PhnD n=1 Tax=Halobacillus karajensis TaxID=195088 RepID=A0A024P517_9BACI|nr:PhnD/SsuA/transferrin family substrate-binding protein [Halobacillus karajensis]CDQ20814.1 Phosphate-import protein PhnD precursor [Halobacillus karajensis]CDQ23716.1 Phosphate-import protein PhnD precursor [Halobacillus karajensis]CDQ27194.1 Phosphate-import protein PhnD precursor [Halobacillus karajensis]